MRHQAYIATKQVVESFGIKVNFVLSEPVAAAINNLHFAWKMKRPRREQANSLRIINDMGGGTFDVSLLRGDLGWSERVPEVDDGSDSDADFKKSTLRVKRVGGMLSC